MLAVKISQRLNGLSIEQPFFFTVAALWSKNELMIGNKNKAGYTAELVACDWAGAAMQKLPEKRRKSKCVTERQTDQPTNQGPT